MMKRERSGCQPYEGEIDNAVINAYYFQFELAVLRFLPATGIPRACAVASPALHNLVCGYFYCQIFSILTTDKAREVEEWQEHRNQYEGDDSPDYENKGRFEDWQRSRGTIVW